MKLKHKNLIIKLLNGIGITGELEQQLIVNLIPLWSNMEDKKKMGVIDLIQGDFDKGKLLVIMNEFSNER